MHPDRQALHEIVRASLPPGALLDMSLSIGASGLDSLRMARIVLALESLLDTELADAEVERLLVSRSIETLIDEMMAVAKSREARGR